MNRKTFVLLIKKIKIYQLNYWESFCRKIINEGHKFIVIIKNPNFKLDSFYFKHATIFEFRKNISDNDIYEEINISLDDANIEILDSKINSIRNFNDFKIEHLRNGKDNFIKYLFQVKKDIIHSIEYKTFNIKNKEFLIPFFKKNFSSLEINKIIKEISFYLKKYFLLEHNFSNEKNIVMISDSNQFKYSLINSKLINDQIKSNIKNFKIHLIFFDLKTREIEEANNFKEKFNLLNVNFYFLNSLKFNLYFSKINHITNVANARLYLPYILENIENVLYLDNDTVVIGDILDSFMFFSKDKSYAQSWNKMNNWSLFFNSKFKVHKNKSYFNSGVLYLSLKKMREDSFKENVNIFIEKWGQKLKYFDQDVLNANVTLNNMPNNFNFARSFWPKKEKWFSKISDLKIFHFLSVNKQWNTEIKTIKGSLTKSEMKKMQHAKYYWINEFNGVDWKDKK